MDFPELGELLAVPHLDPAGGREILSPDGLWRARAEADLDAEGGDVFFELDFGAPRPTRVVLPALVVDAYAPGAPEAPQAPQEPVPKMQAVGWLLGALIGSILLFQAGLRERVVALNEGGEVVVSWGRRAPLILAHLPARGLQEVSIDREVRLSMSRRGGGRSDVRRRDDRFRVKARGLLGRVDLGSYATEALAEAAVKHTRSWA